MVESFRGGGGFVDVGGGRGVVLRSASGLKVSFSFALRRLFCRANGQLGTQASVSAARQSFPSERRAEAGQLKPRFTGWVGGNGGRFSVKSGSRVQKRVPVFVKLVPRGMAVEGFVRNEYLFAKNWYLFGQILRRCSENGPGFC
jgi:hypothetical protein